MTSRPERLVEPTATTATETGSSGSVRLMSAPPRPAWETNHQSSAVGAEGTLGSPSTSRVAIVHGAS